MSDTPRNPPNEHAAILGPLRAVLTATLRYLKARLGIVSRESGDAFAVVAGALLFLLSTVAVLAVGWFFIGIALTELIATWLPGGHARIWAALIVAAVHLASAACLAGAALLRLKQPMFPITLQEFDKDSAWLETETTNEPNHSQTERKPTSRP